MVYKDTVFSKQKWDIIKGTTRNRKRSWKTIKYDCQDLILYIENPKDTTKKLSEHIENFSKVTEY